MKFVLGVFGIITDSGNKVLLGKDSKHRRWVLPGGRVEAGEDLEQALIREIKEETGLTVLVNNLVGVYSRPEKPDVSFVFKCKLLHGQLQKGYEMSELDYFSEDNLPKPLHPRLKLRLHHYWHPCPEIPVIRQD